MELRGNGFKTIRKPRDKLNYGLELSDTLLGPNGTKLEQWRGQIVDKMHDKWINYGIRSDAALADVDLLAEYFYSPGLRHQHIWFLLLGRILDGKFNQMYIVKQLRFKA